MSNEPTAAEGLQGATLAAYYPRRVMRPILVSKRELRTLSMENFLALFLMSAGFGGISFGVGIVVDWAMQDVHSEAALALVQVLAPITGGFGLLLIIVGVIVLLYRKGDIEDVEGETEYPDEPGGAVVLAPGGITPLGRPKSGEEREQSPEERHDK